MNIKPEDPTPSSGTTVGQKENKMPDIRKETDSLGEVDVPADKLWGAQTQRSLEHFSIGKDLIPREMITAYAILKKGAANANFAGKRLDKKHHDLIVQVCDEILAGQHHDMFPLHVWMTGSGTQFNMNVNEVISNRCSQIAGTPLGSKTPVHPNDHVNMSQSSNDSFPSAMNIAAAVNVKQRLIPAVKQLHDAIAEKEEWDDIVKIGRTHMPRRHAAHTWARVVRLPRRACRRSRSDRRCAEGRLSPRARRYGGGYRNQFSPRLRRGRCRRDR
jgi:fumarate hydratase class II